MGLESGAEAGPEVEEDPRPYVHALREFVRTSREGEGQGQGQGLAIADAAKLWGQLWRQGVPWTTLLLNSINHPNRDGLRLFVDALLPLFPAH